MKEEEFVGRGVGPNAEELIAQGRRGPTMGRKDRGVGAKDERG